MVGTALFIQIGADFLYQNTVTTKPISKPSNYKVMYFEMGKESVECQLLCFAPTVSSLFVDRF